MPIRITRVYTRTGDTGQTALVGGRRVPKDSPRIEAYGTIDELNAVIGLARAFNAEHLAGSSPGAGSGRRRARPSGAASRDQEGHRWLDEVLRRIQNELFDLGSELATPPDAAWDGMARVGDAQVAALEGLIDHCQKELKPLKSFVLPGGGRVGGFLHQARTVARRAERRILALSGVEPIGPGPVKYVNRLGDLLFVLSRWVGQRLGETEYLWERGLQSHERRRR
jgi:cob(I)alamin adenosyltransferase